MSRVFLHIGMHKTGSTAIQSAFAGYETSRTRYADLGYENHSIPFYTAYSGQHHNYHIWRAAGLRPEEIEAQKDLCRARIEAAVAGAGKRNLIFSGEDISQLPRAGVEEIYALFARYDCDVQVIIYVREPVSFVQSNFQEDIKSGKNTDHPRPPEFRKRIEKFLDVFGCDKVTIRLFDRLALYENDIVKDFSNVIGVKAPDRGKNDNSSLSTEAVRIIYELNKLVPVMGEQAELVRARWRMIGQVSSLFPGRFEIPADIVAGVIDADDSEWLYRISGIDFRTSHAAQIEFSATALADYLGAFKDITLETVRAHLIQHCGIANPPTEKHYLLSRYFMSFLHNGWSPDFKFDPERYLTLNPDVRSAGVDPCRHYLLFGLAEGRPVK